MHLYGAWGIRETTASLQIGTTIEAHGVQASHGGSTPTSLQLKNTIVAREEQASHRGSTPTSLQLENTIEAREVQASHRGSTPTSLQTTNIIEAHEVQASHRGSAPASLPKVFTCVLAKVVGWRTVHEVLVGWCRTAPGARRLPCRPDRYNSGKGLWAPLGFNEFLKNLERF